MRTLNPVTHFLYVLPKIFQQATHGVSGDSGHLFEIIFILVGDVGIAHVRNYLEATVNFW